MMIGFCEDRIGISYSIGCIPELTDLPLFASLDCLSRTGILPVSLVPVMYGLDSFASMLTTVKTMMNHLYDVIIKNYYPGKNSRLWLVSDSDLVGARETISRIALSGRPSTRNNRSIRSIELQQLVGD